ncbi:ABC transporter ATP-binding protein [Bradyrhizobium sp. LHD-71]|uniref:ABC transporter ATP-binding protein n=1 Tax=Bradyrhizobium sp. LHD-71 TaxID=3072141 RepID=UPI00280F2242|nr:ABC transporter ATP-binding protein [Bradyrhizobium sp. LHD-71]MDQ8731457.1 ABC transporter ATP-binding protein [Bradyrhizobium sp. LHD-71]
MASISIANLRKSFGRVEVVKGVNLRINSGEFVTLLGASGSGKTTTLRMLAGLERADSGTISVNGSVLNGEGNFVPAHKRGMGMVFQSYAIWPHRTVYQNVAFPLRMKRVRPAEERAKVERILELVELPVAKFGDRYASQLSGGQQQRVSLARALVADPQVVLYDEPLSNLDARLRESMRTLLRTIHKETRLTALYVTHDQLEAMVMADRVCVMDQGIIVQEGAPRDLYDRPANQFVAEFIGQANIFDLSDVSREKGAVRLSNGISLNIPPGNWPNGEATRDRKLVIRHHHACVLTNDAPAGADNLLPGRIKDSIYLGDRIRTTLTLAGALEFVAEGIDGPSTSDIGKDVIVAVPPQFCIVV